MLVAPWLGSDGQQAFYRQIAQADQAHTDEIEPRYRELDLPVLVVWGQEDTWTPSTAHIVSPSRRYDPQAVAPVGVGEPPAP
jgi:hypothetical protein